MISCYARSQCSASTPPDITTDALSSPPLLCMSSLKCCPGAAAAAPGVAAGGHPSPLETARGHAEDTHDLAGPTATHSTSRVRQWQPPSCGPSCPWGGRRSTLHRRFCCIDGDGGSEPGYWGQGSAIAAACVDGALAVPGSPVPPHRGDIGDAG